MATYPRLNRLFDHAAALDRAPAPAEPSVETASPEPLIAALINNADILAALDAGEGMTTEQVIARLGLLATVPLQLRMARALGELGYIHAVVSVSATPMRAARVWLPVRPEPTTPPAPSVSDYARRVHTAPEPRPGPIARLIALLRGAR